MKSVLLSLLVLLALTACNKPAHAVIAGSPTARQAVKQSDTAPDGVRFNLAPLAAKDFVDTRRK